MAIRDADEQEHYTLTITADSVTSTDESFSIDDLATGYNYEPIDVYFEKTSGAEIRCSREWGEFGFSNETMPLLAFQCFERQIDALSAEEKANFPICKYNPLSEMVRGIFTNLEEVRYRNALMEKVIYNYGNGRQFIIDYCNVFSTIYFVQECLRRFGEPGDQFVLKYQRV